VIRRGYFAVAIFRRTWVVEDVRDRHNQPRSSAPLCGRSLRELIEAEDSKRREYDQRAGRIPRGILWHLVQSGSSSTRFQPAPCRSSCTGDCAVRPKLPHSVRSVLDV
jgi:hypothetical protein